MSPRTRARLAWSLLAIYVALTAIAAVLVGLTGNWGDLVWLTIFVAFPFVGALIASREAGGALGWIALAIGIAVAITAVVEDYGIYALEESSGGLPGGRYGVWFASYSWLLFIGLIGLFVLLFPDGRLPSRRWKPAVWLGAFGAAAAGTAIALGPDRNDYSAPIENPVGVDAEPFLEGLVIVGFVAFLAFMLSAVASVVVRYRRSRGEERQQMKWFVSAVVFTAAVFVASFRPPPCRPRSQTGWRWRACSPGRRFRSRRPSRSCATASTTSTS